MKKRVRFVVALGVIYSLGLGCSSPQQASPAPPAAPATTAPPAPAGTAPSMPTAIGADGVAKLLADAKGKVVVLNFWATWCPPCVAEMPEFAKFYNSANRDQVSFISLCANDPSELRTLVAAFQKDKSLPFPVYVLNDPGGVDGLNKALNAQLTGALPSTLIFDKTGALKVFWERDTTFDELTATVKPLL